MEEYSSSNHDSNLSHPMNNDNEAMNNYGCSQKYKGVVPQQNGNWGAQIYANNRRIWLGTFKSEIDAAVAYDRASIKVRSSDASRNFPWTEITFQEANFQKHHNMESVLSMIKDGTYQAKFNDFWNLEKEKENNNNNNKKKKNGVSTEKGKSGFSCRVLFQKELTPSDVGKLNRLVIPKKYAVRYFPHVPDNDEINTSHGVNNNEVNLTFYDPQKRLWKFRYCYWKSSQSFVFTRGWNQFVKEKALSAKDRIVFYYHENLEVSNMGFWVIDTCRVSNDEGVGLELGVGGCDHQKEVVEEEEESLEDQKMDDVIIERSSVQTKGLKLFGVYIVQ